MRFIVTAVVFAVVVEKSFSLRCWKCSSDIDPSCRDPFNEYGSRSYRQNGYDNLQPSSYNQRPYDNYNTRYDNQRYDNQRYDNQRYDNRDPNYNPNYNQGGLGYNSGSYSAGNRPAVLEVCDENEARNRRMRNVCLKEIIRGSSYVSVIRRCALVPYETTVGTCSQETNRGLTLDFCEYCDWDGCNSATGLRTNIYIAAAISSILLFFYH